MTSEGLKFSSGCLQKTYHFFDAKGPHRGSFLSVLLLAALSSSSLSAQITSEVPTKVLIVVAHPDDEYYFAATTYRIAVELHGIVDALVITNGEGGFHYSTLAEPFYQKPLTNEAVGQNALS